jgi:light-regulated signal transduction histidine kinase (bacteriophytochrome)
LTGWVSVVRDITERQQSAQNLAHYAAELRRSNRDLEHFAYIASHDLQEPLRTVRSFVQLFAQRYTGALDEKGERYIEFIVDGTQRMQALIDGLLAYSGVNTHGEVFATVDCNVALENALSNLQLRIAESNAAIDHDPLPTLEGDAIQLTQLFQNLIDNAIKFQQQ